MQFKEKELGIVILSCDKFEDIWDLAATNVVENLGFLESQIYLVSNEKYFNKEGIVNIQTGKDFDWSSSLKNALSLIKEEYLLILLEDVYITKLNFPELLQRCICEMKSMDIDCLHIRKVPRPRSREKNDFLHIYHPNQPYTANVLSFWRKNTLNNLLVSGETAWEFEIKGSYRLNKNGRSGCLKKSLFEYEHLIIKGKWNSSIRKFNAFKSGNVNLASRDVSRQKAVTNLAKNTLFNLVLNWLPLIVSTRILKIFRRLS